LAKKVLITGAAGFVGRHLTAYLKNKGYEIVGMDNFQHPVKNWEEIASDVLYGDVTAISKYVIGDRVGILGFPFTETDFDVVVHLAATISVDYSLEDPWYSIYNNVIGTLNMLEFCRIYDIKLVYVSTCEVYGTLQYKDRPMDEKHPLNPQHPYGASKLAGEFLCQTYMKTYGLEVNIMRPFNIFGPYQREDDYGAVIAIFTRRALQGEPPIIHGDGNQTRDYVFVDDIVRAYEIAINEVFKGEPVNFGSGRETSINELADLVLKFTGRTDLKPIHGPPRPNDIRRSWCDASKAYELFGWKAEISFEEGLKRYINWRKQFA
jgi:UDP-glucose 4-epimerase